MKVKMVDDDLIIVPETEFEKEWLESKDTAATEVFHKCGVTPAHFIGIKIVFSGKEIKKGGDHE